MLAQEMYCRKVEGSAAGHTPSSLEDDGLASQLFQFLPLLFGFCAVALD